MSKTRLLAKGARAVLAGLYAPMKKLCRTNPDKVVLLSRQSDEPSIDFQMVLREIHVRLPNAKTVVITRRMEKNWRSIAVFLMAQITSLYHLATSRVAILESYWPAVSALDHKKELTVFQLWHSLGKIKKSGRQTVGKEQGWSEDVAKELRMHGGYDFVIAGGKAWNPAYCSSFGISEDQIINIGLPRADFLLHERQKIRRSILSRYPQLDDGQAVVLYAPTFRRHGGASGGAADVLRSVDLDRNHLIIKGHANQPLTASNRRHLECPEFSGMELLTVADLLITDYSAIAVEAAVLGLKTFYYLYDYDEYIRQNGLNLDLPSEFPELVAYTTDQLQAKLGERYPLETLRRYQQKYLFDDPGHSTADLVTALQEKGRLCQSQ